MEIVKKIAKRYDQYKIRRNRRKREKTVSGIPEGMTFETLNDLCRSHKESPLKAVCYNHISAWKTFGAYRLTLETQRGEKWRLIYKNDLYTKEVNPAIEGLPVVPGPPEYSVYGDSGEPLSEYLPEVYLRREISASEHYQYILEDMGEEYRKLVNTPNDLNIITGNLPLIHRALKEWSGFDKKNYYFPYDYDYARSLDSYLWTNLENYRRDYLKRTGDDTISHICRLREKITSIRLDKEFYAYPNRHPIHGDLNLSNILIHKENNHSIKLIDWEWAGIGSAYADLASLLQRTPPEVEEAAVKDFSKTANTLSIKEHRRLYQWCKMERGLINAAYVMVLIINSRGKFGLSPGFIKKSMINALNAFKELTTSN